MEKAKILISIIIPAFNEEKMLPGVLEALKNQEDVVVINDGSKDKTGEIAKNFGVGTITFEKNMGKTRAFEAGINYCKEKGTQIMVVLDADIVDITQEKIEQLVKPLLENEKLTMTVAQAVEGDKKEGYDEEAALRYNGVRAFRFSALYKLCEDRETWNDFVGERKYPEPGLFLMFSKSETQFLPDVQFHHREMARGERHILGSENRDIDALQNILWQREQQGKERPARFRK